MDSLKFLEPSDVMDTKMFARYCHQKLGVPTDSIRDIQVLNRYVKQFFTEYPHATYGTLCRVVDWCGARKKRPPHAYSVVKMYRYAWSDGFLPELNPSGVDEELEEKIAMTLKVEHDATWRDRLEYAMGVTARREVYDAWVKVRRPVVLLEVISSGRTSVVS